MLYQSRGIKQEASTGFRGNCEERAHEAPDDPFQETGTIRVDERRVFTPVELDMGGVQLLLAGILRRLRVGAPLAVMMECDLTRIGDLVSAKDDSRRQIGINSIVPKTLAEPSESLTDLTDDTGPEDALIDVQHTCS